MSPSSGPVGGGQSIKIKGTGFLPTSTVTIGSEAREVHVVSETEIKAKTAPGSAGEDAVVVSNADGTSVLGPLYDYLAPAG